MKVYIIKECGNEWEDYQESIIKAFFSKEKAESYKQELEQEENEKAAEYIICCNCPMRDIEFKSFYELKVCLKEYCGKFEYISDNNKKTKINQAFIDSKNWDCIDCVNYIEWHDDTWYKIEEIEVEE